MSAAAAVAEAVPPPKGKKKLIIIIVAVAALVLAGGGGAAVLMMKKKAAAEADVAEGGEADTAVEAVAKRDPKAVPVFVPLDPFTVNLADRDAERYAQVGITLEIDDLKTGDQIKNYMPAIRNNILLALADRTAAELLGRDGKVRLADRVIKETSRALGYEVEADEAAAAPGEEQAAAARKKTRKSKLPPLPVKAVHFSNFIIQ